MLTKTYFRRKLAQACGLGLVLCAAAACAPQQNVLTKEEIADGWQLLFDGKTLDQWKDYNGEELTMPWHVVDGCIQAKGDGSDLSQGQRQLLSIARAAVSDPPVMILD